MGLETQEPQAVHAEVVIRAGEVIRCPDCRRPVAEAVRDLRLGEPVRQEMFLSRGFTLASLRMHPEDYPEICPVCGAYWYAQGSLYVAGRGWIPSNPF